MADIYTLVEQLKIETDPLRAGIIKALLRRINIMETLPFTSTGRLNIKVTRWASLPTPQFRPANDVFSSSIGTQEQLEESVYIAGGNIDIERIYTEESDGATIVDPRQNQLSMFMSAMAYMINEYFINGDVAMDPNGFVGLKVRVSNLPARQTVDAATDGLDVLASDENMFEYLDKLDELCDVIEDGNADVLLMNRTSRLKTRSVLRRLKLFETTRDMFDREVMIYRGARILDMGWTAAGAFTGTDATMIIGNAESQGSSGAICTSIYAAKWGRDAGLDLHGHEMHPLKVTDIGLLENAAQKRTNIEWPMGLALFNPFAAARLRGIIWS